MEGSFDTGVVFAEFEGAVRIAFQRYAVRAIQGQAGEYLVVDPEEQIVLSESGVFGSPFTAETIVPHLFNIHGRFFV